MNLINFNNEIGRVITTLDMIDFFCEYVNDDLEPLIEDGYTFYSVDKRLLRDSAF